MIDGSAIRRGAAWVFAGSVGHQILSFAAGIVLARLLAPDDFGALLTIQVFTGLAGFLSGGGMGQGLVRAKTASKADFDVVFTLQSCIGVLIYTIFFATAPLFARWYDNPLYIDLLRLSALSFIFRPLINMPSSLLHREMRFKARAAVGMGTLVASSTVSISLAILDFGVWSLVWGGITGSAVQCALLTYLTRWRPGFSMDIRRAAELARYGVLVTGNDLVDYIKSRVSIIILSHNLGPQAVGLYNKGQSLSDMPFDFIAGSVYQVLFRTLSICQDELDKCRYMFYRSITLVSVYGTPFYIALIWLAEPFVRGVFGERWVMAVGPLRIIALAWPFWLVANMSGAVIAAHNRLDKELRINIATLVLLVLSLLVVHPFGINGVAWAVAAVRAISSIFLIRLGITTIEARWKITIQALVPAVLLNGILALAFFLVESTIPSWIVDHDLLYVLVFGIFGALVYSVCILFIPITALEGERARWRKMAFRFVRKRSHIF